MSIVASFANDFVVDICTGRWSLLGVHMKDGKSIRIGKTKNTEYTKDREIWRVGISESAEIVGLVPLAMMP